MIQPWQLEILAERLRVYDVDQEGWEHEGQGFEVNAAHTLTHLAPSITSKDFTDPEVVEKVIAPDAMQYALRLGRWTEQAAITLLPRIEHIRRTQATSKRFGSMPIHQVVFIEATSALGSNLHDHGHRSSREKAISEEVHAARQVAGLLLRCAGLQAEQYQFDLTEVFDARLADLRERFNIPESR